jgi:hypothetical protein
VQDSQSSAENLADTRTGILSIGGYIGSSALSGKISLTSSKIF